jgi:hypothetical protein
MELTLRILHIICAAALLAAHSTFFFRGLAIEARRITPGKLDRLARSLSQALLPAAVLSGLVLRYTGSRTVLHLVLGLTPLITIPLIFFGRLLLRKRTQAPWLLPLVNLILLAAAMLSGIAAWR